MSPNYSEINRKNWPGTLMFGLLYPAVLGTFFYSLLPETLGFVRAPMQMDALQGTKLFLAYLLIAHFVVDFYYTQQVALETSNYPLKMFLLDLAIVLALFVAYDTVHLDERTAKPEVSWIAGSVFISYILFRAWEHSMRAVIGRSCGLAVYETIAAIIFLFIAVVYPNVYVLAGALAMSAVSMYIIGGPIVQRFHDQSEARGDSGT